MATVGYEQGCSYVVKPMEGRERRDARLVLARNNGLRGMV